MSKYKEIKIHKDCVDDTSDQSCCVRAYKPDGITYDHRIVFIEKRAYEDLEEKLRVAIEALEKLAKPFDVHYETNYYAICQYDKKIAEEALTKLKSEGE